MSASGVKKLVKVTTICVGALLTMGNQKCEQKPARTLKKIVQVSPIAASPVQLPGGSSFDFQYVANQQMYAVLMNSKEFTFRYVPPMPAPSGDVGAFAISESKRFNLTESDALAMKAFSQMQQPSASLQSLEHGTTAWCMVNVPQAEIIGSINSFEMVGSGGVTIGYTPSGAHSTVGLGSVGLNVEWAQLDLSMMALRPLTSKVMAATNVKSKQTKTKVHFNLNFGTISVGPNAYYQTPLAKVTEKALTKAVDDLGKQLQNEEWSTRVLDTQGSHVVLVGGSDVGLEIGDELLVYNEDLYWEGEPCNSKYLGGGAAPNSAAAKIVLEWVGDEIARGVIAEEGSRPAVIGAKVKLSKFHDADYKAPDAGVRQPVNSSLAAGTAVNGN